MSEHYGYISASDTNRVIRVVEAHGLPSSLKSPLAIEALFSAMGKDKKVRAGSLRFVVMDVIGVAATKDDVALDVVDRIWGDVGAFD